MLYDVAKILTLYDECTLCYYPSKSIEIHRKSSKLIKLIFILDLTIYSRTFSTIMVICIMKIIHC